MNCKGHIHGNGIHQTDGEGTGQDSQRAPIPFPFQYFILFGLERKKSDSWIHESWR